MPPQERIRTLRACDSCSSRKVKCDGADECSQCKKLGVACVYIPSGKKRGPPKGCIARGGPKRRVVETKTEDTKSSPPPSIHSAHSDHGAFHPGSIHSSHVDLMPDGIDLSPQGTCNPLMLDVGTVPDYTEFPMEMLSNDTFVPIIKPQPYRSPRALPLQATPLANQLSLPSHSHSPDMSGATGLSEEAIDALLIIYETFIHPHWPVIYLPALRSLRCLQKQAPLLWDAILAISVANADVAEGKELMPLDDLRPRESWIALGKSMLESVREKLIATYFTSGDLSTVQALVLVALVDLGFGRSSLAYQMGGMACRLAIDLGLHTEARPLVETAPRMGDGRRKQEQRRTLWACYLLDKVLAATLQRPVMLRVADIDCPRPSTMEREELDLWLTGSAHHFVHPTVAASMESVKAHALSAFIAFCDVMVILETILDQVYRPAARRARMENSDAAAYDESIVHIDVALRRWRASLPPHLQWRDDDPGAHALVGPHILTMRGWYGTCLILIHRPRVPYLTSCSPDADAIEALQALKAPESEVSSLRMPKGADASRDAATGICKMMEQFGRTFRIRKFPTSWPYFIFQAATVHAGLAAYSSPALPAATRFESKQRLDECIKWLDQISVTWASAGHDVEILRQLCEVGAKTRPPSAMGLSVPFDGTLSESQPSPLPLESFDTSTMDNANLPQLPQVDQHDLIDTWMLFWASMPTASEDVSLWQGFSEMFTN